MKERFFLEWKCAFVACVFFEHCFCALYSLHTIDMKCVNIFFTRGYSYTFVYAKKIIKKYIPQIK